MTAPRLSSVSRLATTAIGWPTSVAVHGSDRTEIHIRAVSSGDDLPEVLAHTKFASVAWLPWIAAASFTTDTRPLKRLTPFTKTMLSIFHRLGTEQDAGSETVRPAGMIPASPSHPRLATMANSSSCASGTAAIARNRLYYRRTSDDGPFVQLIDEPDALYVFLGNDGDTFFLHTDWESPRGRVMAVDLNRPERTNWQELIPESDDAIASAGMVNNGFYLVHMHHARDRLTLYRPDGTLYQEVELPGLGTLAFCKRGRPTPNLLSASKSFLQPPTVYRYDMRRTN